VAAPLPSNLAAIMSASGRAAGKLIRHLR